MQFAFGWMAKTHRIGYNFQNTYVWIGSRRISRGEGNWLSPTRSRHPGAHCSKRTLNTCPFKWLTFPRSNHNNLHLRNCHLFSFSTFEVFLGPSQEAGAVTREPRTICSNQSTSSVIQGGCDMLLRDASQIEHKTSTQRCSATSLPGVHRDRVELTDVSHEHLVNHRKGRAG